jgi:hypothetical protein
MSARSCSSHVTDVNTVIKSCPSGPEKRLWAGDLVLDSDLDIGDMEEALSTLNIAAWLQQRCGTEDEGSGFAAPAGSAADKEWIR